MTTSETQNGTSNADLAQRVSRLEGRIMDKRSRGVYCSLIGPMWMVLVVVAIFWSRYLPYAGMAWLVCIAMGIVAGSLLRGWNRSGDSCDGRTK